MFMDVVSYMLVRNIAYNSKKMARDKNIGNLKYGLHKNEQKQDWGTNMLYTSMYQQRYMLMYYSIYLMCA